MTRRRLAVAQALMLFVVAGCTEPETQSGVTSTTSEPPVATTDQEVEVGRSTTTSAPIPTTTSSAPTSTTEGPGTTLSNQDPPVLELLPPGANQVIPISEIDDYYIFARAVGVTSVTTLFESRVSAPGRADEAWSVELRVDGTSEHLIYEAQSQRGEAITTEDGFWFRSEGEEWQAGEGSDEGETESSLLTAYASPDVAYNVAYQVFDELEFNGWLQVGDSSHAVYRGDVEDALVGEPGTAEVMWSPDGYFSQVRVEWAEGEETVSFSWTVSEVGTTVVEAPG